MNFIAVLILFTLLTAYLLELTADILNIRRLGKEMPPEFSDVYDPQRYRQSGEYLRVNTCFGQIQAAFDLIILLLFWFGKGFALLDQWLRSFGWGPVMTGVAYMGILLLCKNLLSLPFSVYSTFVIEEKFGFNKTDLKTFVTDRIKGLFLFLVLGIPLLAGILAFFEYRGSTAWLWCWISVTLFMLFMQYIAPTWIMPLFNKFEPLEEGKRKEMIMDYARKVSYPLQALFVMDGSRRSGKSNAFFTGFGKNKRIALFDTLIAQHSEEELLAILAHEIGHYKKKHILQGMIIGIVHSGFVFFLLSFFISCPMLFDAFYMEKPSVYAGIIFFGMLFSPLDFFLGILLQMRSRKNEYEADRFAVQSTGNPRAMIRALKKLAAHNLSNLLPHPFYVFLHYSHPPVGERLRAIKELSAKGSAHADCLS